MVGICLAVGVFIAIPIIIYKILNPPYDPYKIESPGMWQRYKNVSDDFNTYLFMIKREHEKKDIERRIAEEREKNRKDLFS